MNVPFHELQVSDVVPAENIDGILIPHEYTIEPLINLPIIGSSCRKDHLMKNVTNLDLFFQNEFSRSILSDDVQEALSDAYKGIEWDTSSVDYLDHEKIRKALIKNLSQKIMVNVIDVYKEVLGKDDITAIDILKHHAPERVFVEVLTDWTHPHATAHQHVTENRQDTPEQRSAFNCQ